MIGVVLKVLGITADSTKSFPRSRLFSHVLSARRLRGDIVCRTLPTPPPTAPTPPTAPIPSGEPTSPGMALPCPFVYRARPVRPRGGSRGPPAGHPFTLPRPAGREEARVSPRRDISF